MDDERVKLADLRVGDRVLVDWYKAAPRCVGTICRIGYRLVMLRYDTGGEARLNSRMKVWRIAPCATP
jgi:hypothetical protein